jgi:hypothetical protein
LGRIVTRKRLKKDVRRVGHPEDFLVTLQEKAAVARLLAQGMSEPHASDWLLERREKQVPKPPIPAGTVVETWLVAHCGDNPEDDPNPLLGVEAPDCGEGFTFKDDTYPL